jgi:hypothetical protein
LKRKTKGKLWMYFEKIGLDLEGKKTRDAFGMLRII